MDSSLSQFQTCGRGISRRGADRWFRAGGFVGAILAVMSTAQASTLLSENFDDVTTLPGSGWAQINHSAPIGTTGWFQGEAAFFPA